MALTVCKSCGKTVSDTVETCIHCGGSINGETIEQNVQQNVRLQEETSANTEATKEHDVYDYFIYSEDRRLSLEKAFIESDKWAYNYRRTEEEIRKFKSLFESIILFNMLSSFALMLAFMFIFDFKAYKVDLIYIALAGSAILFVLSSLMSVVLHFMIKARRNAPERLVYLKKYQKWLLEEKNISFNPKFKKKGSQEAFANISVDKFTI